MMNNGRIALIILGLVLLWMLTGMFVNKDIEKYDDVQTLPTVQTMNIDLIKKEINFSGLGIVEPSKRITINTEAVGEVKEILIKSGNNVKENDLFIRIDPKDKFEKKRQAEATLTQKQIEYDVEVRLKADKHSSDKNLSRAMAALEESRANVKMAEVNLDSALIRIPFTGYLNRILVDEGSVVNPSIPLAELVSFDPFEVSVYVSAEYAKRINNLSRAIIDMGDNKMVSGKVHFVSRIGDKLTNKYEVRIRVEDYGAAVYAFKDVDVSLSLGEMEAYRIPMSSLCLDDEGRIGVKFVDEDNIVQFIAVEILDSDPDMYWVKDKEEINNDFIELITVGHNTVKVGTKVAY